MAWQGFRPACRIRTPAAKALPGFIFAYARAWGMNGRDGSSYLMEVFCWQTVSFWLFGAYNRARGDSIAVAYAVEPAFADIGPTEHEV